MSCHFHTGQKPKLKTEEKKKKTIDTERYKKNHDITILHETNVI